MQVILVGHDFGGACISYAMELFPLKVAKAIFLAAAMLKNGQSTLDTFSQQVSLSLFLFEFVNLLIFTREMYFKIWLDYIFRAWYEKYWTAMKHYKN